MQLASVCQRIKSLSNLLVTYKFTDIFQNASKFVNMSESIDLKFITDKQEVIQC